MLEIEWGENPLLYGNAGEAHSGDACVDISVSDFSLGVDAVELRHITELIIS